MATVLDTLLAKKAAILETVSADVQRVEAEIAALPTEVHQLEQEVWVKIRAIFGQ